MKWTDEQKEFLKKNYPILGVKWCAKELNLPPKKVKSYVEYLKLKHKKLTDELLPKTLKCSKCKQLKSIQEFQKNGNQRRRDCSKCRTIYRNKYNKLNRQKVLNTRKLWRDSNADTILSKRRLRYLTNLQENIKSKLRARIRSVLTKGRKSDSTVKLLGCSVEFFVKDFESKFSSDMSWEAVLNGEIHIDHKKPCAAFDLTKPEQQRECFHYTNLQPLWAIDNLSKGDCFNPLHEHT